MMKQFNLLFILLLLMSLGGCGNGNSKGIHEGSTSQAEEAVQKPSNKPYVGREIPIVDNPESDFKIVKAKITGTIENSGSGGYELRLWIMPKKEITVYNSQYQTQWGYTKEGRLSKYDISNYYLYLRFVTSEGETIGCKMIAPFSNSYDYVSETTVNPKYRSKAVKKHPAGEWCHEEGTRAALHIDRFRLIDDLDHIEFMDKDDYSQWLSYRY